MSNIETDLSNFSPGIADTHHRTAESLETPVFEYPQKLRGGGKKSLLSIALAGPLAVLFPVKNDAAQQACTQTTVISTESATPVNSSADGECITVQESERQLAWVSSVAGAESVSSLGLGAMRTECVRGR